MSVAADFSPMVAAIETQAEEKAKELHGLSVKIKNASGDASQLKTVIEQSEDENVIKIRETLEQLNAKRKELEDKLSDWARKAIADPDFDLEAANKKFKESRTELRNFLTQSIGMLETMGQETGKLQELKDNLPGTSGAPTSTTGRSPEEMARIRQWAKENGHEVSERGRIKQEIIDAYEKRNDPAETPVDSAE